jgi:hypothetical protein
MIPLVARWYQIPDGWKITPERIARAIRTAEILSFESEPGPKPEWWSPAWEELTKVTRGDGVKIEPVSPAQFKEFVNDDVFMMDEIGTELGKYPITGEPPDPSTDPDLIHMASGVIWNEQGATLIRKGAKGVDPNELLLSQFEMAVKLSPNDCAMHYGTHSDWLLDQWTQMMEWKSLHYQGLDRSACPYQWKGIMGVLKGLTRGLEMMKLETMVVDQAIVKAAVLYAQEGILWLREDIATPVDAVRRPEAPWF